MHVGIFADIEGAFGIWRMRQCRMGTREWQYGRGRLTEDVNSVIQGVCDAGAERILVKDTHEVGFNCLIHRLDSRACYRGGHFIVPTFYGDIHDLDLVLYVAIHAASGTEHAFFPHTHYGIFSEVRLNGKRVCEMDIYGAYLGEFGIPVGFVSGEDVAVAQAKDALPWVGSVIVDKRKEAYTAGEKSRRYLAEGRERLRQAAAEAVCNISRMKPLTLAGPLHFEAVFRDEKLAAKHNTWHFRQSGRMVEWDAGTMIEGFEMLNKLTFFPRKMYPYRRPLLFLMRSFFRVKNTWFAPQSDPGETVVPTIS